jgi:hypothetical protein
MADFQMRTHADFGTSEPWVARTWISIMRIREFVYFGEEREAFDRLHIAIIENLHECFNAMRLLHKTIAEHEAKVSSQEIFRSRGAASRYNRKHRRSDESGVEGFLY